jgi:hypothetical protein
MMQTPRLSGKKIRKKNILSEDEIVTLLETFYILDAGNLLPAMGAPFPKD